jgi:hypothetical protein
MGTKVCETPIGTALCPESLGPEFPIQGRFTDQIYKYIEVSERAHPPTTYSRSHMKRTPAPGPKHRWHPIHTYARAHTQTHTHIALYR